MKTRILFIAMIILALGQIQSQDWQLMVINRRTGNFQEVKPGSRIIATMQSGIRLSGYTEIVDDTTLKLGGKVVPLDSVQSLTAKTRQAQTTGGIVAGVGGALMAGGLIIFISNQEGDSFIGFLEDVGNWAVAGLVAGAGVAALGTGIAILVPKKYSAAKYRFEIHRSVRDTPIKSRN